MRHVNPHQASSELAAVWYAANYCYKVSFTRRVEYVGWVFQRPNGTFGVTVRSGFWKTSIPVISTSIVLRWHQHELAGVLLCGEVLLRLHDVRERIFTCDKRSYAPLPDVAHDVVEDDILLKRTTEEGEVPEVERAHVEFQPIYEISDLCAGIDSALNQNAIFDCTDNHESSTNDQTRSSSGASTGH